MNSPSSGAGRKVNHALVAVVGVAALGAAVAYGSTRVSPASAPAIVSAEPALRSHPEPVVPAEPRVAAAAPAGAASQAQLTSLIYTVYDPNGAETRFLRAEPGAASIPVELLRAAHAEGFPPRAALSADGATLAYTSLPPGAGRRSKAEVVVVDLTTGQRTTIATDAHYFTTPILAPGAVIYSRQTAGPEPGESPKDGSAGAYQEMRTEVLRYDLARAQSARIFDRSVVSLDLIGLHGSDVYAVLRTHAASSVVAMDARSGAQRDVVAAKPGRDVAYASLGAGGRYLLFGDRQNGGSEVSLGRVELRSGGLEPLGIFPYDDPPARLSGDLLVRAHEGALLLEPLGAGSAPRALQGPRPNATSAGIEGLSGSGRYVVARWLAGATQVYAVVDTTDGSMRALPPPRGGDLHGMNAEVVGFFTRDAAAGGTK